MRQFPPCRIICLTEETVETLYLLGEQLRIVGVSGYAVRPPQVRREKPRVSAFKDASFGKILDLRPDLVLAFSDVQAEITRELVLRGVTVLNFNQRSIAEILEMIALLSRIHFFAVNFVVPPGEAEIGGEHVRAGVDVADHALAGGNGAREDVLDGMAGLGLGDGGIGRGAETGVTKGCIRGGVRGVVVIRVNDVARRAAA